MSQTLNHSYNTESNNGLRLYWLIWNVASTIHFFDESNIIDKSARFPKTSDKPPNKIDFPAPVSPVIQVMPSENSTSKSSIMAKFFIFNLVSKFDFF